MSKDIPVLVMLLAVMLSALIIPSCVVCKSVQQIDSIPITQLEDVPNEQLDIRIEALESQIRMMNIRIQRLENLAKELEQYVDKRYSSPSDG